MGWGGVGWSGDGSRDSSCLTLRAVLCVTSASSFFVAFVVVGGCLFVVCCCFLGGRLGDLETVVA